MKLTIILASILKARAENECGQGYWGLGNACFDIDECEHSDFNTCKMDTTCSNTEGGYDCLCPNGDKADFNGNCENDGQQTCPEGFWGLGDSCFDLDECGHPDFNDCKDGTACNNHDGGYSCVCPNGVEANSNGDCLETATTEQPPVDDGLNAADCAGTVDYKFRSGKAKVSRSGENSNLVRLQQAKVKETKAHTGFVSFPKSACGKDFLAGLKDGRVTVDFADKKATYSVIGSYYVDNGSSTQVVVQYNSVPLNVADDKCPKCLGNSSTDQLEMLVMGTKNIEWGSKTAKACLNGALVGHAGAAGAPTLLENDESGCVAWTNAL